MAKGAKPIIPVVTAVPAVTVPIIFVETSTAGWAMRVWTTGFSLVCLSCFFIGCIVFWNVSVVTLTASCTDSLIGYCKISSALEINDSKKLTEKKREELFEKIKENAVCVGVGISSHKEIDEVNILQASLLAMRRAIENLEKEPDYIIVDGLYVPFNSGDIPQRAIIKGDSLVCSIAAASIIAKVTRDRLMKEFALQYPGYKFEKHKGYPTREHISILQKLGPCSIHRRSFKPVGLMCNV